MNYEKPKVTIDLQEYNDLLRDVAKQRETIDKLIIERETIRTADVKPYKIGMAVLLPFLTQNDHHLFIKELEQRGVQFMVYKKHETAEREIEFMFIPTTKPDEEPKS